MPGSVIGSTRGSDPLSLGSYPSWAASRGGVIDLLMLMQYWDCLGTKRSLQHGFWRDMACPMRALSRFTEPDSGFESRPLDIKFLSFSYLEYIPL